MRDAAKEKNLKFSLTAHSTRNLAPPPLASLRLQSWWQPCRAHTQRASVSKGLLSNLTEDVKLPCPPEAGSWQTSFRGQVHVHGGPDDLVLWWRKEIQGLQVRLTLGHFVKLVIRDPDLDIQALAPSKEGKRKGTDTSVAPAAVRPYARVSTSGLS